VEFFADPENLIKGVREKIRILESKKEQDYSWKIAQGVSGYAGLVRAVESGMR
jgi:hypothetical protein